jgi:acyl-CoA reductase-like NAD-dependent aldehyde dehydrogenase
VQRRPAGAQANPLLTGLVAKSPFCPASDDAHSARAAGHDQRAARLRDGQTCIGIERAYVVAPVYDQFVAAVTGDGARPAPDPKGG